VYDIDLAKSFSAFYIYRIPSSISIVYDIDLAESFGAGSNHIREKDGVWAVCAYCGMYAALLRNMHICGALLWEAHVC